MKLLLGNYLINPRQDHLKKESGVAIEDGVIRQVADNRKLQEKYPEAKVIDLRDKVLSPGFINTHMHSYGILSHGIETPEIGSFKDFLEKFWWPKVENQIDHRLIEISTRAAALELIDSGVTTFCNVMEAPNALPGALTTQAEVLEQLNVRAVLSFEASERISRSNGDKGLKENVDFSLEQENNPLISGTMCIHTTFTCSPEFIQKASSLSKENGLAVQMHLNESSYEPKVCKEKYDLTPAQLYRELGLLDNHVLASQGVKLSEEEIQTLKEKEVNLAHVPLSNCEVGGGIAPVPDLLNEGINVSLGTDGYINNFFEVMRAAFLIHKGNLETPDVMPARKVLHLATVNGAKALGLEKLGCLKKGYRADVIALDTDFETPFRDHNYYEQLILRRNPKNVRDVFINGNSVIRNGEFTYSSVDLESARRELNEAASKLWKR